ncbi:MAG: 5-(carboxyamino)imidazole ribonucleotide synthase [Pseudomonadota bacterium]
MVKPLPLGATIGILGGGQLGRMLSVAASRLGFKTHIYEPAPDAPAGHVAAQTTTAGYGSLDALKAFAQSVDVVTYEFENIPTAALDLVEAEVTVFPNRHALATSQDRLLEKTFVQALALSPVRFADINAAKDFESAQAMMTTETILKTRRFGYDGKGQLRLQPGASLEAAWTELGSVPCVLEELIPFTSEISVIGARGQDGQTACYDPGQNEHRNGILHQTVVPADVGAKVKTDAVLATAAILNALDYVGVMGVEFFVTPSGILVNEFAPRVHNSGHWTQQGCAVDQFEQHIRAIAGWPLSNAERHSNVSMQNLIGDDLNNLGQWLADPKSALHLYGKDQARPGRKMGHVNTVTGAP